MAGSSPVAVVSAPVEDAAARAGRRRAGRSRARRAARCESAASRSAASRRPAARRTPRSCPCRDSRRAQCRADRGRRAAPGGRRRSPPCRRRPPRPAASAAPELRSRLRQCGIEPAPLLARIALRRFVDGNVLAADLVHVADGEPGRRGHADQDTRRRVDDRRRRRHLRRRRRPDGRALGLARRTRGQRRRRGGNVGRTGLVAKTRRQQCRQGVHRAPVRRARGPRTSPGRRGSPRARAGRRRSSRWRKRRPAESARRRRTSSPRSPARRPDGREGRWHCAPPRRPTPPCRLPPARLRRRQRRRDSTSRITSRPATTRPLAGWSAPTASPVVITIWVSRLRACVATKSASNSMSGWPAIDPFAVRDARMEALPFQVHGVEADVHEDFDLLRRREGQGVTGRMQLHDGAGTRRPQHGARRDRRRRRRRPSSGRRPDQEPSRAGRSARPTAREDEAARYLSSASFLATGLPDSTPNARGPRPPSPLKGFSSSTVDRAAAAGDDGAATAMPATIPVRPGHAFDVAALSTWMSSHVAGFNGPIDVTQFEGGQSNPTFLLRSPGAAYVLRKKPPGQLLPSAHLVEREYPRHERAGADPRAGTAVPRTL